MSTILMPPELGLYPGVPAVEYHHWEGASQSRLKRMRDKSPAHVRWEMDHPAAPTEALLLGAAIHTCVLEPDRFSELYSTAGQCEATTGKGERCRNSGLVSREGLWFCGIRGHDPQAGQSGDGRIPLVRADWDTCIGIRDAVAAHPNTRHMLEGQAETSAVWRDPDTGVLCRGRFDDLALGIGSITDLKSCEDASPFRFPRSVYDYGYHVQAAMYLRGGKALDLDVDTFGFVAVEKRPPYAVAVYQLQPAAIHDGERELVPLLARWAECEETGVWPGYSTDIVQIDLPAWAPKQIDERLGER
jgi:exodeoxyribonuclease VIII